MLIWNLELPKLKIYKPQQGLRLFFVDIDYKILGYQKFWIIITGYGSNSKPRVFLNKHSYLIKSRH